MIAVESRPPGNEHELLPVCSPRSPTELAVVLSLLESEGFYDLVSNDYFGSLHVGPIIPLFNEKIVLVPETDFEAAKALVTPLDTCDREYSERGFTFFEKFRMAIEVFMFGWIIPWPRSFKDKTDD